MKHNHNNKNNNNKNPCQPNLVWAPKREVSSSTASFYLQAVTRAASLQPIDGHINYNDFQKEINKIEKSPVT